MSVALLSGAPGRRVVTPWLFLTPFALLFVIFFGYPLACSVWLSGRQTFGPGASRFVGLSNFSAILKDPLFWTALRNTAVFTLGSVFIQLPLALLLALALEECGARARAVLRGVLFAPALVGAVYASMIFAVFFEKRTGPLNQLLHGAFGFDLDFAWLQDHIMAALVVAALWMYTGLNMVLFNAALQNVRRDLVEVARLDGAGALGRFRHVTIPAIRPVAAFVVLMSVVGSFQLFELPWIMLDNKPGTNNSGLTVVMYLYQTGFETGDLGYASAIGWALSIVLILCAAGQRRMLRVHGGGA